MCANTLATTVVTVSTLWIEAQLQGFPSILLQSTKSVWFPYKAGQTKFTVYCHKVHISCFYFACGRVVIIQMSDTVLQDKRAKFVHFYIMQCNLPVIVLELILIVYT